MRMQWSGRPSTTIDWSPWKTKKDQLKRKRDLPINKKYRARPTTGKSLMMKTCKPLHQKFSPKGQGSILRTNGWTKTKVFSANFSLNSWALKNSHQKQHTSGTKHWRARDMPRSQHAFNEIPTPLVTPKKGLISKTLHQIPHNRSTPASATRKLGTPKTFAELLGSKTDDGVFSVANLGERPVVMYPERFGIDDE